jgi:tRNA-dihydrouridine synthase
MYPISPHPSPSPEDGRGKLVGLRPLIIGNGDIKSYQEGLDRVAQTKVDGVMVGRGAFGNPWFFAQHLNSNAGTLRSPDSNRDKGGFDAIIQLLKNTVMLEHSKLFTEWLPEKSFMIMRKHFKAYASGFPGSHELRAKLMEAKNLAETEKITNEFLQKQSF